MKDVPSYGVHSGKGRSRLAIGKDGQADRKVHVDTGDFPATTWMDLFKAAFPSWTEEELEKGWDGFAVYTDEDCEYVLMTRKDSENMSPKGDPLRYGIMFWLSVGGGRITQVCLRRRGVIKRTETQLGTVHVFKLANGVVVAQLQTRPEGTTLEKVAVKHELFDVDSIHWVPNWAKEFNEEDRRRIVRDMQDCFDHVTP